MAASSSMTRMRDLGMAGVAFERSSTASCVLQLALTRCRVGRVEIERQDVARPRGARRCAGSRPTESTGLRLISSSTCRARCPASNGGAQRLDARDRARRAVAAAARSRLNAVGVEIADGQAEQRCRIAAAIGATAARARPSRPTPIARRPLGQLHRASTARGRRAARRRSVPACPARAGDLANQLDRRSRPAGRRPTR